MCVPRVDLTGAPPLPSTLLSPCPAVANIGLMAASPDGAWLATAGHNGAVNLWSCGAKDGRLEHVDVGVCAVEPVAAMVWLSPTRLLAAAGACLFVWDVDGA